MDKLLDGKGIVVDYVDESEMEFKKQGFYKGADGHYKLKKFEYGSVATMTHITFFTGKIINIRDVLYLLPLTPSQKNDGIIYPPGTITSLRLPPKDKTGKPIVRGRPGGIFNNSLFINIWTSSNTKHICARLLPTSKIHTCGCRSVTMCEETCRLVLEKLREATVFLEKAKARPDLVKQAFEWIRERSGEVGITLQPVDKTSRDFLVYEEREDHLIDRNFYWEDVPEEFRYYVKEIIDRTLDLEYISELEMRLKYIMSVEVLTEGPLEMDFVSSSMVNLTYHFRFPIDRLYVTRELQKLGFMAEYINTNKSHVGVNMQSGLEADPKTVTRRPNKKNGQIFKIYSGGKISQSGPGGKMMEDCYVKLMKAMIYILDGKIPLLQ